MKRSLDFSALIQWSNTIGEIPISGRSSLLPKKVESKQKESADYFGLQDRHVWGPKHLAYYTSDLFGNELVKTSHMTELNAIVKEERKRLEKETASNRSHRSQWRHSQHQKQAGVTSSRTPQGTDLRSCHWRGRATGA